MSNTDAAFVGSIPDLYDRYLGPILFEPFAVDIAARFIGFDGAILETAAGTGRVTRALARVVGPRATIMATDLNEPMLARAAELVQAPGIEWRQADAQALPFDDAGFDAVVCQFGVMFFPDKAAGYTEARRVLKPGGRYVFNVWDSLEANDMSKVVHAAVGSLFPDNPAEFLTRGPFGYYDEGVIRDALAAANFFNIEVERVTLETPAPSAADAAEGIVRGSPLGTEIETTHPGRLDDVVEAVAEALSRKFGEGRPAMGRALVVTARA